MNIRIVERERISPYKTVIVLAVSLVAGFIGVSIIFLLNGVNPLFALARIFTGSFGSAYGLSETVTKSIPLMLIGVGLCLPFQGKFWNIGAESQLLMGALFGTWAGITFLGSIPGPIAIFAIFVIGFASGAAWGIIPAFLKIRFAVNEVISTLMLNYVAAEFAQFLIIGPMKGKTKFGFPYSDDIAKAAVLPLIPGTRIHYATLMLGLSLAVVMFFVLYNSKFGYEVRVTGENREAARYAGINFMKVSILMMAFSGGLAGFAGAGEILGLHHHMTLPSSISSGYGFTAIIVAWLARLNPLFVILSSFFFAGILVGGDAIQIALKLPAATVQVFNGILLIFLIAGEYFMQNRIVVSAAKKEQIWES